MFQYLRRVAAGPLWALLRARYLIQAQPHSLLSGLEKREEIKKWQAMTGHKLFVETGTFLGETTLAMSGVFERCWTVEIDRLLYEQALVRFDGRRNITALHGDSATLIGDILKDIDAPAIFGWTVTIPKPTQDAAQSIRRLSLSCGRSSSTRSINTSSSSTMRAIFSV